MNNNTAANMKPLHAEPVVSINQPVISGPKKPPVLPVMNKFNGYKTNNDKETNKSRDKIKLLGWTSLLELSVLTRVG